MRFWQKNGCGGCGGGGMPGWLAKMLIRKKCGGGGNPLGIVLIIIGAIMVAVCIPPWFWVALVGVAAVAIGAWLFFRPKC